MEYGCSNGRDSLVLEGTSSRGIWSRFPSFFRCVLAFGGYFHVSPLESRGETGEGGMSETWGLDDWLKAPLWTVGLDLSADAPIARWETTKLLELKLK